MAPPEKVSPNSKKKKKDLSDVVIENDEEYKEAKIGIITSEWNDEVTGILFEGCISSLKAAGVRKKNITELKVPGSFELPSAAKLLAESKRLDAVICLGSIIKGETRHDEYLAQAVAKGIMDLNLRYNIAFIFGVLTTDNIQQAHDRAGGAHGNKGVEAAVTALRMIALKKSLQK